jgi:hypothetical protein
VPGGPRPLVREADRERLLALLREHYARGELDHPEFDRRVGVVLSARYLHEAAAAVADLELADAGAAGPNPVRHRRGHAQSPTPAAGWIPTDERFRDPTTGTIMRVWLDPADQSRHYVPDQEA